MPGQNRLIPRDRAETWEDAICPICQTLIGGVGYRKDLSVVFECDCRQWTPEPPVSLEEWLRTVPRPTVCRDVKEGTD
jgi:hypothetical protein